MEVAMLGVLISFIVYFGYSGLKTQSKSVTIEDKPPAPITLEAGPPIKSNPEKTKFCRDCNNHDIRLGYGMFSVNDYDVCTKFIDEVTGEPKIMHCSFARTNLCLGKYWTPKLNN